MSTSAVSFASDRNKPILTNGRKHVQAKLQVNEPGDVYEQEADAMADRVMRMRSSNENSSVNPVTGLIGKSVQRKCAHCEEEEKKRVMRKEATGSATTTVSNSFTAALQGSAGSGSSLPAATKGFMESAFNTDFSNVRIHTGGEAVAMNNAINAKAFTYGNDIYFSEGAYCLETAAGSKLLAHELTHTIQQSENTTGTLMRQGGGSGTAPTRQQIISDVRRAAMVRVSVAYLRINGTSPNFDRARELRIVRGLIAPDIVNFEQIVEIVGSILNKLSADDRIQIGPEIDQCTGAMGWNAYVAGNRLPIHLCERFFAPGFSREQQIRTLIHEAAHASGIGQAAGESYFMYFDCSPSSEDNWAVADAWARYIHCISGQTPDSPPPVIGTP
jgi:hypothetical protein